MGKSSLLAVFSLCFFLNTSLTFSQELDATVDVDLSRLASDAKDRLTEFKNDIRNYLNKTKFTDEVIVNDVKGKPYKIKCNFQIYFMDATGFDSYDAQLVLFVQRNVFRTAKFTPIMKIKDENWAFNYVRGQSFYHDDLRYNSLTSFLDYYAYMIIGYDDDSWELKLGDKRFTKARDVVNIAGANSDGKGWTDNTTTKAARSTYPQEILNSKYENFRQGLWMYHFAGLDSIQYNKRQALERIAQAIELIGKSRKSEIRSFTIKAFFEAKYLEIAQTLVDYYDKTIYRKLDEIDPDHISTYDEYAKK